MEELTLSLMLQLMLPLIAGGALLFALLAPALLFIESLISLLVSLFGGGRDE